MKRGEKGYTKADFKKHLKVAIVLSLIACVLYGISSIWEIIDFWEDLRITVIFLEIFMMPILLLVAWCKCIKRYLYLEVDALGEENKLSRRVWVYLGVIMMLCLGSGVWHGYTNMIDYLKDIWKIADGLYDCVSIKVGIFVGWLLCFVCSILVQRIMKANGKVVAKALIIAVIVGSSVFLVKYEQTSKDYIEKQTSSVWTQKMIEYYQEQGTDYRVEPFFK